jgi:hypothetical protein
VNNTPQLAEFGPRWFGELGGLALLRVTGKPFTVTEFDVPAPSDYACEMYPLFATFAGLQDWDGLFTFDSVGTGAEHDDGAMRTFFDQHHHPAKWALGPFATRVFRDALVPSPSSSRELLVRGPLWEQAYHLDVLWLKQQTGQDLGFLTDRLSVNENTTASPTRGGFRRLDVTRVERRGSPDAAVIRLVQARRGTVYLVDASHATALVGYLGDATVGTGHLAVTCDSFGLNFASVTAVALDGKPIFLSSRILVTVAARAENQGSVWNAARTSVGDVWGKGGTPIAERVPATIRIKLHGPRRVHALASDGSIAAEIASNEDAVDWLSFSTRAGPPTLHYEILPP